jgi:hypothetical protein
MSLTTAPQQLFGMPVENPGTQYRPPAPLQFQHMPVAKTVGNALGRITGPVQALVLAGQMMVPGVVGQNAGQLSGFQPALIQHSGFGG